MSILCACVSVQNGTARNKLKEINDRKHDFFLFFTKIYCVNLYKIPNTREYFMCVYVENLMILHFLFLFNVKYSVASSA